MDHHADLARDLRSRYPELFTEEGRVRWERLARLLEEQERFGLRWAGKGEAARLALPPSRMAAVPERARSLDFETARNAIYVGDNLEALRLLAASHLGQVKLIYIDPPYNTGRDFAYRDRFASGAASYLERDGLVSNPEIAGRLHAGWASFMYARLALARPLLREDGVIFISIDDNEVHHLRAILDEVFGEGNFVAQIAWRRNTGQANNGAFARVKEHILCYAKDAARLKLNRLPLGPQALREYRYVDEATGRRFRRGRLHHKSRGRYHYTVVSPTGQEFSGPWMIPQEEFERLEREGLIYWASAGEGQPCDKIFLDQNQGSIPNDFWGIDAGTNQDGVLALDELFGCKVFTFPKPVSLLKQIITIGASQDDLILDFFAGSGTTAQAVMELNLEDGGARRFLLVQLPEPLVNPLLAALGLRTIADITIERARRAAERLKPAEGGGDFGFRVFRLEPPDPLKKI